MEIKKSVRIPEEIYEEIKVIIKDINSKYSYMEKKYNISRFIRWCFALGIREYKKNGLEAL